MAERGNFRFKIADPAKALLDFLYLNPHFDSEDHYFELRLNFWEIEEKFNLKKFEAYLQLFSSKALAGRAEKFIEFLKDHDVFV